MAARVALLAVAACGRVGFDPLAGTGAGDARGDATRCVMPMPFDSFDTAGAPCGTWGSTDTLVASDRHGGALHVTPPANAGQGFAGCTISPYDMTQPTFVEVSAIATAPSGYTLLSFYTASHNVALIAYTDTGKLDVADESSSRGSLGEASYDAAALRWWRVQPLGPTQVVAQVSADGQTWSQLGTTKDISPDKLTDGGTIVFGAGVYANEAAPGTAVFDGWNACP